MDLIRNPRVLIALFSCTIASYAIGTLEATLSMFLESLDLPIKLIAVAFLVMPVCSVVATPLMGYLCDKVLSPWLVSIVGCLLMFVCFLFIGPAPYLPLFTPNLYTVCASLVAQGFGCAAVMVASFGCAQVSAVSGDFPSSSMEVQALVSGMFTSSFAIGNFFGPTLSGVLYDELGGGTAGFASNTVVLQALVMVTLGANFLTYLDGTKFCML